MNENLNEMKNYFDAIKEDAITRGRIAEVFRDDVYGLWRCQYVGDIVWNEDDDALAYEPWESKVTVSSDWFGTKSLEEIFYNTWVMHENPGTVLVGTPFVYWEEFALDIETWLHIHNAEAEEALAKYDTADEAVGVV